MISIDQWIDSLLTFPQMSFLKPVFAVVILLLAVDLTFNLAFATLSRFFR